VSDPLVTHSLDGFPAAAIRFVRALERNREQIGKDHDLSPSDLRALFWIAEMGSVTPKDVAIHMEMTTGGITAIANRLVDSGLLQRVAHPNDRRSLYLELSAVGHETMRVIHTDFRTMVADSTSRLTPAELQAFEVALDIVAAEVNARSRR
jgi:DNA-binding MarR family transcriptional regulator